MRKRRVRTRGGACRSAAESLLAQPVVLGLGVRLHLTGRLDRCVQLGVVLAEVCRRWPPASYPRSTPRFDPYRPGTTLVGGGRRGGAQGDGGEGQQNGQQLDHGAHHRSAPRQGSITAEPHPSPADATSRPPSPRSALAALTGERGRRSRRRLRPTVSGRLLGSAVPSTTTSARSSPCLDSHVSDGLLLGLPGFSAHTARIRSHGTTHVSR
jgi:hypothetical protein